MEVEVISLTEKAVEERDYRNEIEIKINGVRVFRVNDGEPEDSNLSRDFNDCWNIPNLMKKAYQAGVIGNEMTIKWTEVDK